MGKPPSQAPSPDTAPLGPLAVHELLIRWESAFKRSPPPGTRREFLLASLAYREQELAEGGLSPQAQKALREVARNLAQKTSSAAPLGPLKPGTRLLRTWQGERHEVLVLEKGFSHDGRTYASLSEIARAITRARWSGPLFFGLKAPSPAKRPPANGAR